MELLRLVVPMALTVLLATVLCCGFEGPVDTTAEAGDVDSSLNPAQDSLRTDKLQDVAEDSVKKSCEEGDTTECRAPSQQQQEEQISLEKDTAHSAGTESDDGTEINSRKKEKRNDPLEGENPEEEDQNEAETTKPPQSKITMQMFGAEDADSEEEGGGTDGQSEKRRKGDEDEMWTEQTEEDGTEQKKSGGRRFFSLMNLIKFLLNPVIEEFQEMEKSSTASQESTATTATTADTANQSEVAGLPAGNATDVGAGDREKKNGTESSKKTKFQCVGRNVTENTTAAVRIVNSTLLLETLSFDKNHTGSDCVLVMFYAPWCHFCAATAPHYNAIARAFPQLDVLAVDTVHFSNLNARFGTVAVPNIMLFHQSRSAVRFNHTERHFNTLVQFITNATGLEANSSVELSDADYQGPLSSTPTEETDYLLWFAWFFIIVCSGHIFIASQAGQRAIERVMVLWQEHQHQHIE